MTNYQRNINFGQWDMVVLYLVLLEHIPFRSNKIAHHLWLYELFVDNQKYKLNANQQNFQFHEQVSTHCFQSSKNV